MDEREEWRRRRAVERHLRGEKARTICVGLGRTERWLYKWLERFHEGGPEWYRGYSRKPIQTPSRTSSEIEEVV
jgi:transposase